LIEWLQQQKMPTQKSYLGKWRWNDQIDKNQKTTYAVKIFRCKPSFDFTYVF
jgi:hypothetical protein